MLNYIWAGLIIISVIFALWQDGSDFVNHRYRNGDALSVEIQGLPPDYEAQDSLKNVEVTVQIDPDEYLAFFDPIGQMGYADDSPEAAKLRKQVVDFFNKPLPATLKTSDKGRELYITKPTSLPVPLDAIYGIHKSDTDDLPALITSWDSFEVTKPEIKADETSPTTEASSEQREAVAEVTAETTESTEVSTEVTTEPAEELEPASATATATAYITFGHTGFVKMHTIGEVMFKKAKGAVTLALELIGVIALWMGMMKIAENSGLIDIFVKIVRPVLSPLFPQLPKDHPALGLIALNLAANMLGLGNAATPFGIKAMESLQELNPEKDTATNSMIMLLAINTAGVQLIPPVTLIAILGIAAGDVFVPILIVTGLSMVIAIVTTILLSRMKMFKKSDPMRNGPVKPQTVEGGAA